LKIPVFLPEPLNWELSRSIHGKFGNPRQLSNFGPLVMRLEQKISEFLRVDPGNVVVFNSATSAISAGLWAQARVGKILIPGFSFVATLRSSQSFWPVDVVVRDVNYSSWVLESPAVEDEGDAVYLPVSPFGEDPSVTALSFLGRPAVIDCAASIGGQPDCSKMDLQHTYCFSLHSTKVLGAGEGGFAVFGTTEAASRARGWSNFGRTGDQYFASGYNAKMSEVQAAFCLSRLEEWETEREEWLQAQELAKEVSSTLNLSLSPTGFSLINPYWLVKVPSNVYRDNLQRILADQGIGSARWWSRELSELSGGPSLPNSSKLVEQTIGLPMFRSLNQEMADRIGNALLIAKSELGPLSIGAEGS